MNDGKKIKYNLIMGIFGQVLVLVFGILMPRLVITSYGSEINGLLSSVTNIYAYVALLEAGVAGAACQALYKALADRNRNDVNAVMAATNKYYHRTGVLYLVCIVALSIIYPIAIRSEIPYHTVVLVILLNGIGNVINFFFHGKYLILLKADGKNYIRTGLDTFTNTMKQIAKIVLIGLGYDVVLVQLVAMIVSFIQMAYITYYIKKNYIWLDLKAEPNMEAIAHSKNVIAHEINFMLSANTDGVLLAIFNTLKAVSVYSLYQMLFHTVFKVLFVVREAIEFKIADIYHKSREIFKRLFMAFEVYYITGAFAVLSVVYFFILPFIRIYTQGVTDINYIIPTVPLLFVLNNMLLAGRYPVEVMIYISGHFKQTQKSAVTETVINIVSSLALVQFWGMEGVLIGTLLAYLYRMIYLISYVNRNIICRSIKHTYLCLGINFAVFLITIYINRAIQIRLDSYFRIIIACIPYTVLTLLLYIGVVSLCIPDAFAAALELVLGINRRSIKSSKSAGIRRKIKNNSAGSEGKEE